MTRQKGMFQMRVYVDDEPIIKANINNEKDIDDMTKTLKRKFG